MLPVVRWSTHTLGETRREGRAHGRGPRAALGAMLALALLIASIGTPSVAAQTGAPRAPALLPASHWSIPVARRLAALDLADADFGWGDGSLTTVAVGRVLFAAATRAPAKAPDVALLAAGYWRRFAREFPATAAAIDRESQAAAGRLEGWASLGFAAASGRVFPVRSLDRTRENVAGPFERRNLAELEARADLGLAAGSHLAGWLAPEHRDGQWRIREGYLLASAGKLGLWAGRRAPEFATGAGGGIVFNGTAAFTGGGVLLTAPGRLPWVLRHLGAIRFETFLSNIDSNATVRRPWVIGTHGSISPHPRVLIGATQTFMFGGEGVGPFTWRNFKEMFTSHAVNITGAEFENGLASFEVRFRPPVPVVPVELYVEWGTEDNHAAWTLFPGLVGGARVPAIPGLPALSLGLEHTYFATPCRPGDASCHNEYYATWYRHYLFQDGWTLDRQPIGHPLGGDGTEWLLYGAWDDPRRPLRVDGRAFLRRRGAYNLYAAYGTYGPTRAGQSVGGMMTAAYRMPSGMDLLLRAALEQGRAEWREASVFAGVRWAF